MSETHDLGNLEKVILKHVSSSKYQPVKPRVIAKQLKLDDEQARELKRVIKRLVKVGKIEYGNKHLVRKVTQKKPDKSLITGVFRRAAAGYGFVRPEAASRLGSMKNDIFIPARKTLDASSGDLVSVRIRTKRGDDERKTSGAIVEVLERDTHQFVGVYLERDGVALVNVDGKVFGEPVPVGDPGAKNASEGDKVVIEMVRFPSTFRGGEGVIVEVLGPRGKPGVDTLSILREFRLPEEFPEEVLESAREQAEAFDESIGDRMDLTGETIITIDPKDARDFDDAISLEQLDNGHWRLGVHIADVSHFVPADTAVDVEARDRATSVYLPDRVIPMLPEIISNNLASLQPNRVRYAKTALIEMTADGARVATEVHNVAIKSKKRFTYEQIDDFLADRAAWKKKLTLKVFSLLERMHTLAMILRRRRLDGGAIELTLPEVKIDLNKKGEVAGAHLVEHTESHQIIEEFMLAANEAVAELFNDQELIFLRRVHEPPNPRKLKALTQFVRELGIECESLESRFEIKRVIQQVAGLPEEHAANIAVLRSMSKAVYSPETVGHYALNSNNYCHFTSPIRRYPDLTIHRMIDALAQGRKPPQQMGPLMNLGDHCSDREQRAEQAERELVKVKLLTYMSKRIGSKFAAVVTGVEDYGLFAQGVELPAEGLIQVSTLQDDYYRYDSASRSLIGNKQGNSYRLGDLIQVEVAHVDIDRRELDFRLVKRLKRAATPLRKRAAAKKKPSKKRRAQNKQAKTPRSAKKTKRAGTANSRTKGPKGKGKRKRR